jgi:hypothetical protein
MQYKPTGQARWHAIVNVSGYLPESDPGDFTFGDWQDALNALVEELERTWDMAADADAEAADAAYMDAHTAMHNATAGQEFLVYTVTNIGSDHDIPTAWQIVRSES